MDWSPGCGLPGPEEINAGLVRIPAASAEAERLRRIGAPVEQPEVKVASVAEIPSR